LLRPAGRTKRSAAKAAPTNESERSALVGAGSWARACPRSEVIRAKRGFVGAGSWARACPRSEAIRAKRGLNFSGLAVHGAFVPFSANAA